MRVPARALKYCSLAMCVAAVVGVALVLLPGRGSAHEGGYLDFSGPNSGYLQVPDNAALNPTGAITVEAWVYLNSYDGWGLDPNFNDCPMLVGKNWTNSYALALGCGGDVIDSFINGIDYAPDSPTIPLQTWTHLAMTYDGATRLNYQDGIPVSQVTDSEGPIGDTADPLRIGNDVQWDFSPNGRIDDVRIWNVARTQLEILTGMTGVNPSAPGLAADWTFDNSSLTDETSGLTGTLVGNVQLAEDNDTPTPTPTLSSSPSATPFNGEPSPGDDDCDGNVTAEDGGGLLGGLAGAKKSPPTPLLICHDHGARVDNRPARDDANCDGLVNVLDVLAIFKHVAGLITLPAACTTPTPTGTPN